MLLINQKPAADASGMPGRAVARVAPVHPERQREVTFYST